MNKIEYPGKSFFKKGKYLAWKKEDFTVLLEKNRTVEILRNSISFFEGDKSGLNFFGIVKLFACSAKFMALYYYAIGNGYDARFLLDEKKVIFYWKQ